MWTIDEVEINGGFLPGLKIALPTGLICIIGPRGSGKSTLAEALRFAVKGSSGAPKKRVDLLQANVGNNGLVTLAITTDAKLKNTLRRGLKQPAVLLTGEGRPVSGVDLDRGTYLPIDAYNSEEIESIADQVLGETRRTLLDELRGSELSAIHLSLGEQRRALEANADQIRAARRTIGDLGERIEEFGDVRAQLSALEPAAETGPSTVYDKALKQQQRNAKEKKRADDFLQALRLLTEEAGKFKSRIEQTRTTQIAEEDSANAELLQRRQPDVQKSLANAVKHLANAAAAVDAAIAALEQVRSDLGESHTKQTAEFTELQQVHQQADERSRARLDLQQRVTHLDEIQAEQAREKERLGQLLDSRRTLKARFLLEREKISTLRETVATELTSEAGEKIRVRVLRNADDLAYRNLLTQGLKGAGVRNHDEILASLLQLRPEQFAQLIQTDDHDGFDEACGFGQERAKKILGAFRLNVDPLQLEVVEIDDVVHIELNVATSAEAIFKDAADLSRGQKCTALLPLLLARTQNPLVIDQPEDNLDNHFIYETVVNSIQRLKKKRQMIFITHNANIPVLADADLVIVMNSDGKIGYIEKSGSVDDCREQIVDLLEGGREAFELRRKRYGGK
jgi:energy-coupling factor transporter ATP-binding protein EcfA2/DNA-binding transcriptional regulator YdaS (Cro superfamily)